MVRSGRFTGIPSQIGFRFRDADQHEICRGFVRGRRQFKPPGGVLYNADALAFNGEDALGAAQAGAGVAQKRRKGVSGDRAVRMEASGLVALFDMGDALFPLL